MSVIQKDMKHLKEKQKNLDFFLQFLDISKLRLLQIINEEQEALNTLKTIKNANSQFLNRLNESFFKSSGIFESEKEHEFLKSKGSKIYFLVDAKEEDEFSEIIYKKLEETLTRDVNKENDVIVTFGNKVNLICQKHEYNVIQHFSYDLFLNYDKFIDKVATLIEIGLKNNVFYKAELIVAQQNQDNRELVSQKLFPLVREEKEEKVFDGTRTLEVEKENISYTTELVRAQQNASEDYINFFHDINIRKINWFPNVSFFKYKFIKSVIKQNIVELRMVEKIQRMKMELHLLDEKRSKLVDEAAIVGRWINRIRKEKSTEATIVLYAAFKLKQNESNDFDAPIRKKRESDTMLVNKRGGK